MYVCATCDESYIYQCDCDDHMDDYDHWADCDVCPRRFRSQRACDQHMNALQHWAPQFECETCTRTFSSEAAANQHMRATGHWKNYCRECSRQFQNENNYRMHMNSRIHRGTDVKCPFCNVRFVTASGASHHLEMGACPEASNWNRETIHRAIRSLDPHGLITKKQIEWHQEEHIEYSATDAAFDGHYWVCYFCKKKFNYHNALDRHLNSPVHQEKLYHCLNQRGGCQKEFTSLGALFGHLESESCGYTRFENVQNVHRQLNEAVQGRRAITGLGF